MLQLLLATLAAWSLQTPAQDVLSIRLLPPDGQPVELASLARGRLLVVAYTGIGCPLGARWAPRLVELEAAFRGRGVRFVGVNANPQDARSALAREAEELGFEFPLLKDARQELTRALGARSTTEVFLLDAAGVLRYRGAIDDQHSLDGSRPQPSARYLADALEALLNGKEPAIPRTEAPGCKLTILPEGEPPAAPTWSEHVAPIVASRCASCHQPSGGAPFALQTYAQAQGWSEMIGEVLAERRMPPWAAHGRFAGHFANERALDTWERNVLERWLENGAPEGEQGVLASSPRSAAGWRLSLPDAEYAMETRLEWNGRELVEQALPPEGFAVPRQGVVEYQYFAVQTDFASERWVRAVEVRPGATDVVHHVLVWAENPEAPGNWLEDGSFRNYFAVTVPGDFPTVYPAGHAKRLPAGARLIFQIHYTPDGKEHADRTRVAFSFSEEAAPREVITGAVVNTRFQIPPGAAAHEVRARLRLEEDVELLSLFPHMHLRGKDFSYHALLPSGTELDLLECRFTFDWQDSYQWKQPVALPRGTILECAGHFDNSADNLANPDPTREVTWGDQTFEEMFIGYFDYVRAETPSGTR